MHDQGLHGLPVDRMEAPLTGYLALRVADFAHPRDVLSDPNLDPVEKRKILAAWASDASAVNSRPTFRWLSGTPGPVSLLHVLAALRDLDAETEQQSAVISTMVAGAVSPTAVW